MEPEGSLQCSQDHAYGTAQYVNNFISFSISLFHKIPFAAQAFLFSHQYANE
jgi:hypothetical protein